MPEFVLYLKDVRKRDYVGGDRLQITLDKEHVTEDHKELIDLLGKDCKVTITPAPDAQQELPLDEE